MLADDAPVGSHHLPRSLQRRLALLGQISVEKLLVVSARDKANLLRVRLLGNHQRMLASQLADFRLGHPTQRKHRPAKLLLREPKEEISLVLTLVRRTLQQPPPALFIESHLSVM